MDRIRLIELIEGRTARLSAEGRGLWEELEFLKESIPDPEEPSRMAREYDIMERIFKLPVPEQLLTGQLRGAGGCPAKGRSGGAPRGVWGQPAGSWRDQRRHAQRP